MTHIQPDTHLPKTPFIKRAILLLTQTSTNAPTVVEAMNNTGATWTPSYVGGGAYRLTPSILTIQAAKTSIRIAQHSETGFRVIKTHTTLSGDNIATIEIETWDGTASTANDILNNTALEIAIFNI